MKKLLSTAAVIGLVTIAAAPAMAQGDESALKLGVGGFFRGYVIWHDQDTDTASDERSFDILRDTEVHFTGETTLENGLTVGFHTELEDDMGDGFAVNESYMFVSGSWGRMNFGGEDGAAYLLQVAAPSADTNLDGIRQNIDPVNYGIAPDPAGAVDFDDLAALEFDYDQDRTANDDKITYITPVFSGFQVGASYTPEVDATSRTFGVSTDDAAGDYGSAWDAAIRYEGQFDSFGLTAGAGYTHVDLEDDAAGLDDQTLWNVGAAITVGAFGLGVVYTDDDQGTDPESDINTWTVGADYTSGPYKIGASWYNRDEDDFVGTDELDTDRYAGGVSYTYGPGMTFRGSVSYINHDIADEDMDATTFLLGTQVNF